MDKPSAFDLAEFHVLQQFYEVWEALHAIPNDKLHKKQKEEAARKILDKVLVLRRMKNDRQTILVPRFAH